MKRVVSGRKRVVVGVHLYAAPSALRATLEALRENTAAGYELLLLPDGPDEETRALLSELDLPQSATVEPLGAAACFNRLARASDAEVVVFLESGALVAPGWLEKLLSALEADPRNGLAGPSTNCAWNEQCVIETRDGSREELRRAASIVAHHFGQETRTLEPLYSLSDFCYAVKRETIETVGAADEAYGLGPCWEMDYNIRAARAGFRGIWVCGAFVYRAPLNTRRALEDSRLLERNKLLYQDKFCGARLRGETLGYRSHCRGDACANFAPADLIQVRRAWPAPRRASEDDANARAADARARVEAASITSPAPLVSCIMPTWNRRAFINQALRCFQSQDYPNLELIIVDDGAEAIEELLPADERVRYFRLPARASIGAKRNFACRAAPGEFIAHWDDDDWYPSWRVKAQLLALSENNADLCGSSRVLYYEPSTGKSWRYEYTDDALAWVAGNTLFYRRGVWEAQPFPEIQVGEDSLFVMNHAGRKALDLKRPELCVGMVHEGNTSRKETDGIFWFEETSERIAEQVGDALYFYRGLHAPASFSSLPLVSCIMPTFDRPAFVSLALRHFFAQDYPHRELIVVDDGTEPVAELVRDLPGVRYFRLPARASIGAKRNFACRAARGEFIAHWDDDDWYAPDRLSYQLMPLLAGEADLTGLENSYVLSLPDGDFWTTTRQLHEQIFVGDVHGGTLVYRRELLSDELCYPEINLAEDAWLLYRAVKSGGRLRRLSNPGVFIYVRHGRNAWQEFTAGQFVNPSGWERVAPPLSFPAWAAASYVAAATAGHEARRLVDAL